MLINILRKMFLVVAACFVITAAADTAFATHFRYGTVSYQPILNASNQPTGTVQFTLTVSYRRSANGFYTHPTTGAVINNPNVGNQIRLLNTVEGFVFNSAAPSLQLDPTFTVTSIDNSTDSFVATAVFNNTYTSAGPFTAYWEGNARLSTLQANVRDTPYRIETIVRPFSLNRAPTASLPPVINVPKGAVSFFVPATDIDGDPIRYRFANAVENGLSINSALPTLLPAPNNFSKIDPVTGLFTWDTSSLNAAYNVNTLWSTQFVIEDRDPNNINTVKSKTVIEVVLRIVAPAAGQPPVVKINNSASPLQLTAVPGQMITFNVTGEDPDIDPATNQPNTPVTLSASSLPPGAIMNPALSPLTGASPVGSTFSWTPTAAQGGSFVLNFTATDNTSQQDSNSVTIFVQVNQAPTINCPAAPAAVQYQPPLGSTPPLSFNLSDTDGDALTVDWRVNGTPAYSENVPAGFGIRTVTFNQPLGVGNHTIDIVVTDDENAATTSCSVLVSITKADQTIAFDPLAGKTYGDSDFPISATASSNLPVSFAASGNCTVSGGTVHITGAGNCTITASQAGDANYNAAPDVSQSFSIAKAAPIISWSNPADITYGTALGGTQLNATASFQNSPLAGSFDYTPLAGAVLNAGNAQTLSVNFTPTDAANFNSATATVSINVLKAGLTIKADDKSRTYGSTAVSFTVTPTGFVNGDTLSALGGTLAFNFTDAPDKPAGSYTITPSGLTSSNYDITFQDGTLTVSKAALTVTADNASKIYGAANPAFTAQYAGFVLGEDVTVLGGALTFNTAADQTSPVGYYAVTPAGLTSGNYDITFVAGTLQVTPAELLVKTNDAAKTYGDAPVSFGVSYSGFVNGETASVLGGSLAFDFTDTASTAAGSYTVTPSGLTSANYNITFAGGVFSVSKAAITVIANDASRSYGAANPAFDGTLTGIRNGDAITASYNSAADASSPVGMYVITPLLSDPDGKLGNYEVTIVNGTLTINKANQVISWSNPASISYVTPLGNTQLNAVLTAGDGALTYSPGAGTVLSVGSHMLRVDASETANYNPASATVTIEVTNAPPTANAGGPYTVYEGSGVALNGSGSDPENLPLSYAWDLDGNGTFETAGQNATLSAAGLDGFTGSTKTVKLEVTDQGGLKTVSMATVNIDNVAPTITALTGPVDPKAVNTTVNLIVNYTDPAGSLDTYTVTTDWGDGTTDNSTSHVYTSAGVYRVKATVSDEDGGVSNEAVFEYVVIYDPNGGFVTGGGWIDSPAGAYRANLSLTGKASLGFVSKYHNGANVPSGNTEFQFKAANFNFKSTSYEWLVIAGAKAQYKGSGTINGSGDYGFMLTAIDGQRNGGGGVDKFRLKIWDNSDGGIVYDNQVNGDTGDNATPSTALGGGSIVIHKP